MADPDPLNSFNSTVSSILTRMSQQRKYIRLLILSIALDLSLTLVLGFITYKTLHNSNQLSKQNKQAIILACEGVNKSNAANLKLWNYIFTLPPSPATVANLTDEQKAAQAKQLKDFKTYINGVFAPQEC